MRYGLALFAALAILFAADTQAQDPAQVCIRHLVSPTRYPVVARQARIQGTVTASVRIGPHGVLREVVVAAVDPVLVAHPILQDDTQRILSLWSFECHSCASGNSFEHLIKFTYRLEGEDAPYDDTKVIMDLPDQVTIIARPPLCDHCPPSQMKR
jgi:Gram-negative bacterial TonB protein C-terminal